MKGEQMELFSATVVAFPLERWTAHVEEVVRQLDRRSGRLAQKYWNTECNRLHARLQVTGLTRDQISAELARFTVAVQNRRRAAQGSGGAA